MKSNLFCRSHIKWNYCTVEVWCIFFFFQDTNQNQDTGDESNMTVTVLYSKYDVQWLAAIVGTDHAARMVNYERNVHMFMTEE
jgi:hypothetical protein